MGERYAKNEFLHVTLAIIWPFWMIIQNLLERRNAYVGG
jgi:hypothetical protein